MLSVLMHIVAPVFAALTDKKQIQASIEQGEAIREAARAQLQPMVFAHADQIHSGPG